ncbi:hypothetical protein BCR34DRAFT_609455 [Clohesyomyces aquaticus]|uniref:Uncharacterized protein n=1 Tax=Clohesyomyces aquaticus TaxID=1231657 RepID=A0A1Y2AB99_9PLEO|nr:hypothetical protein BCR34DRAFT_609455 [Clohesyomyces aquaticus]
MMPTQSQAGAPAGGAFIPQVSVTRRLAELERLQNKYHQEFARVRNSDPQKALQIRDVARYLSATHHDLRAQRRAQTMSSPRSTSGSLQEMNEHGVRVPVTPAALRTDPRVGSLSLEKWRIIDPPQCRVSNQAWRYRGVRHPYFKFRMCSFGVAARYADEVMMPSSMHSKDDWDTLNDMKRIRNAMVVERLKWRQRIWKDEKRAAELGALGQRSRSNTV